MRRLIVAAAALILMAGVITAQQTSTPQTARQALLEMFFSKTPGTFLKHLPAATKAALEKSGSLEKLQQYSAFASQMQIQSQIQTFETGSLLFSATDPKTGQKLEITVENDALRGDEDDLELSFQTFKDGQPQMTPFKPQLTFSMKQEAQVWTLNEISITVHFPLADPEFLKAITEKVKAQPTAVSTMQGSEVTAQTSESDIQVVAALRSILAAEKTYSSTYTNVGYTCTLSNLDGFGGGEPNEHQAMLINSGLASGKRFGFVFTLSSCTAAPSTSFHLTAVPNASSYNRKTFCADESGVIRSSMDGNPAACFASGTPVH